MDTGDKFGSLMPYFTLEWIKRLSVNTAAFPVSGKGADTTCIHFPEKILGAKVAFDFASMRLNISLPQVSICSSVCGYIPPECDEGIPAALMNYSFTGSRGTDSDSCFLILLRGLNYGP